MTIEGREFSVAPLQKTLQAWTKVMQRTANEIAKKRDEYILHSLPGRVVLIGSGHLPNLSKSKERSICTIQIKGEEAGADKPVLDNIAEFLLKKIEENKKQK